MANLAEAVIFDLDGVLCEYDFPLRLHRLSELCGLEPAEIEARLWTSGFEDTADQGAYDLEEYCRLTAEMLETDLSYEALLSARLAAMRRKDDVIAIARAVKGQVACALLTNNGPFLAQGIRRILPDIADLFGEHAYFSGVLGLAKPDPAAFLAVAERLGSGPERTAFIDDTPAYVAGARQAGLIGHCFRGSDGLRTFLQELGLNI